MLRWLDEYAASNFFAASLVRLEYRLCEIARGIDPQFEQSDADEGVAFANRWLRAGEMFKHLRAIRHPIVVHRVGDMTLATDRKAALDGIEGVLYVDVRPIVALVS